jgi:hypothetical protein
MRQQRIEPAAQPDWIDYGAQPAPANEGRGDTGMPWRL